MKTYQTIIDRALEHIRKQQSPDGSFASLSSFIADDFSGAISRKTTFFTSNIFACLQHIPGETTEVRRAAAGFLRAEKSERWSFNYWARGSRERLTLPYPDDLDDTFAALAALARHDPSFIDRHALSAIAKMLTAREVREGGPYRTWLVPDDAPAAWQDTDLVVNSTIGHFLSLIGVYLPRLEHFIDTAVHEDRLLSPYYPGMFHIGYFLSRYYGNEDKSDIRAKLAETIAPRITQNGGKGITALEQAMAISSLVALGHTKMIEAASVDLLASRLEREGFLSYAFCMDPTRDGVPCYAGATALTAALCAEALARYSASRFPAVIPTPTLHDHIRDLAKTASRNIGGELMAAVITQIESTSDEKITSVAYEFRAALYESGRTVPADIAEQLSLANLYGWMAYKIYDDTLDGGNSSSLIPCANFFLRTLAEIYTSLGARNKGIRSLFNETMDRIDNAYAWEQKYCAISVEEDDPLPQGLPPFGDYQILADRSIGHAMGPLAELLFVGCAADSEEYKNTELFFRHYLIARQLHDDAHDWADDLLRGRVNSIGALVVHHFQERHPHGENMPITKMIPALRKLFWEDILDSGARMIAFHITAAREAREKASFLADVDFMEDALRELETAARRAVKERDEALIFLNDYSASRPSGVQP
jgi:hypothetical protein